MTLLKALLGRIKKMLLRKELNRLRIIEKRLGDQIEARIDARIEALLKPVDANSRPTINALRMALRDLSNSKIALKAIANDVARQRLAEIRTVAPAALPVIGLQSKACTQNHTESLWVAYWCKRLRREIDYHRKS